MRANEANIAADDVVQLELTAASVDGVLVVQPNTAELWATVGVADAAIANGAYGMVQVYGYRSTSRIDGTDTSIALGVPLMASAGGDQLQSVDSTVTQASSTDQEATTLTQNPVVAVLLETITTTNATVSRKIWLKAM